MSSSSLLAHVGINVSGADFLPVLLSSGQVRRLLMDQSLRCQPLEQQAGDGGRLRPGGGCPASAARRSPPRRRACRRRPRVATQIDIHPLRLAVRLGAELAGERQGVGFQDDRELFLDFTNEGRLVALARLALAPGM
jgi:hypothetical protein